MPLWSYANGLCWLPQMMGGKAPMQILRVPSILIHIPECSQKENSGVPSCARWILSAWYATLLFPLLSVGPLRNSSFLQFCTLIRWFSLFAISAFPPDWDERNSYQKVTVMGERVGGEIRTNILLSQRFWSELKAYLLNILSALISKAWVFLRDIQCYILSCALCLLHLSWPLPQFQTYFLHLFLLGPTKIYLSGV